jgi:cycloeucalenol cycloisomerase
MGDTDIAVTMTAVLGTIVAMLAGLVTLQTRRPDADTVSSFLPSIETQPSKRAYELFVACYTPVWIFCFAIIIAFQLYEQFTAVTYLQVCGGLALPFLLQPLLLPTAGFQSPDCKRPLSERYALKANLWLAVYSFIGNYWYTHYFYSVLKAAYTMPAHRLNNVPIAMFLATHFYFSTYHFFSNALLRKVVTTFVPGFRRNVLFGSVILAFSYFTAFMETLTISSYPYYAFEDRFMAYTVGSCFYGIYFIVSFPAFFSFDNQIDNNDKNTIAGQQRKVTLWETFVSSCGYGLIIMTLLDFVRLYLDVPLVVGSSNLTCTSN